MAEISQLRERFHRQVCSQAIYLKNRRIPSIADTSSNLSCSLASGIIEAFGIEVGSTAISGQTAGSKFETAVRDFVQSAMESLEHLRPAEWIYSVHNDISEFVQYRHLAKLNELIQASKDIQTALGDYVVKPDVIVARTSVSDETINEHRTIVHETGIPYLTPLRRRHQKETAPILHASIS